MVRDDKDHRSAVDPLLGAVKYAEDVLNREWYGSNVGPWLSARIRVKYAKEVAWGATRIDPLLSHMDPEMLKAFCREVLTNTTHGLALLDHDIGRLGTSSAYTMSLAPFVADMFRGLGRPTECVESFVSAHDGSTREVELDALALNRWRYAVSDFMDDLVEVKHSEPEPINLAEAELSHWMDTILPMNAGFDEKFSREAGGRVLPTLANMEPWRKRYLVGTAVNIVTDSILPLLFPTQRPIDCAVIYRATHDLLRTLSFRPPQFDIALKELVQGLREATSKAEKTYLLIRFWHVVHDEVGVMCWFDFGLSRHERIFLEVEIGPIQTSSGDELPSIPAQATGGHDKLASGRALASERVRHWARTGDVVRKVVQNSVDDSFRNFVQNYGMMKG